MTMPTFPETSQPHTERWRVERLLVNRDPDGTGIQCEVRDRMVRDGEPTDEYHDRHLTPGDADDLWDSPVEKTFNEWVNIIHSKAG